MLYGVDPASARGAAIDTLLCEQGLNVKHIGANELGNPVGAVVGARGFRPTHLAFAGDAPDTEFMLLHNVPSDPMNKLLDAMRQNDLAIDHKALVTRTNLLWPIGRLIQQVMVEHAVMHG